MVRDAVIVDAVRTGVAKGKPGGALSGWHPVDLLGATLAGLVERNGVDPAMIDDVLAGCVTQVGEQSTNVARSAVLAAGFPESVPGASVDRQCGSSQQALHIAAQGVMAGSYDLAIACGVESMSRVPMASNTLREDPYGPAIAARYPDGLVGQGVSAELIAARWKLTRDDLDGYATTSHQRAAAATADGRTPQELLQIDVDRGEGRTGEPLRADEGVRPDTTVEGLAGLKTVFRTGEMVERFPEVEWAVTAGNASQISDGASAVLVMSAERAAELGLTPRARVHTMTVCGDDPLLMLTGVIPATRKVLDRAGLGLDDIDVFEVNEAFASVVLAWQRETGADLDRVNVRGGAIANGHPLGASGGKLLTTLLHVLEERGGHYGLQTMCEGGGMANATIIERLG